MSEQAGINRQQLIDALLRAAGSCVGAAQHLGIGRATLYRLLDRLQIDPESLRVIGGRYELIAALGQGGQAWVFKARDRSSPNALRALKLFRLTEGTTHSATLENEFRLLSLLRHRGLPRVHDYGSEPRLGIAFVTMDLIAGRPFLEALRGRRIVETAAVLVELLDVLSNLHRAGLVHRDISSANVLVDLSDDSAVRPSVFLVDLGLAQTLAGQRSQPAGKVNYLAPELIDGQPASARSDLYAVGVLGYLGLAGRLPWIDREAAADTDALHPLRLRDVVPHLDGTIERVLTKLVMWDPAQRYGDAASARDDLLSCPLLRRAAWSRTRGVESPLVGRETELHTIAEWRTASDAVPGLAVLAEVGVGKSRLLNAAADEARASGAHVLLLSSRERAGFGLSQLGHGLRSVAARLGADESSREAVLRLAEQLSSPQLGESALASLESGAQLLSTVCGQRGLLLICDDLHEAEAALLDLLASWLRRWSQTGMRLLVASRTPAPGGPLDRMLRAAQVEGSVQKLMLAPLDQRATQQLIAAQTDSAQAAVSSQRLFELTGGNPLFLELVLEESARSEFEAQSSQLPASIEAAAQELVAHLVGPARAWSEVIAVADGPCREEDVQRISGVFMTEQDLGSAASVLIRESGRVDFRHPFLRTVQRGQLEEQRRRDLHLAWAERFDGDNERLLDRAWHLVGAEGGSSAVPVWREAAALLENRWEYQRATPLLEAWLGSLPPSDPSRMALLERIERAYHRVRDERRSLQVCQQWADAARVIGDRDAESRAVAKAAARHRDRGELTAARTLAMQANRLATESGSRQTQAVTAKILGSVLWMGWEHSRALEQFERVLEYVDAQADPHDAALSCHDAAVLIHTEGQQQRALDLLDRSKQLFRAAKDEAWVLSADNNLAYLMASVGDVEAADRLLSNVVTRFSTMTHGLPIDPYLESRAITLWRLGKYEELVDVCDRLIGEASRFSRSEPRIVGLLFRAAALREMDDRAEARRHVRLAVELAEAITAPRQEAFAQLARARDLREDDQPGAAEEIATAIYQQAIAVPRLRVAALAAIECAECALARRMAREALAHLEKAEAALLVNREDASWRRVQFLAVRAQARLADGQRVPALADLEQGLGLARVHGAAADYLVLLRTASRAYADQGDTARSVAMLSEGAATLERLGAAISNPILKARFLGRPDHAAMLDAARRSSGLGRHSASPRLAPASIHGLVDVGQRVAAGEAIEPLLVRVVELAIDASGMERGALVLRRKEGDELYVAAAIGLESETTVDALRLCQRVLDKAMGGQAVIARDARLNPELTDAPSVGLLGIRSVVCLPLRVGEEVRGALYLDTQRVEALWGDQDIGFLEALAAQATLAIEYSELVEKVRSERDLWRAAALPLDSLGEMLGGSSSMADVFERLKKIAPSAVAVVICGETGTGKELAAKAIHALSSRANRPFVAENMATLHESLAESQLFGHARGAFTDAHEARKGLFAQANGGTLFLDEIDGLRQDLQAKLLRVLETGEFTPLGASESVRVDVRVVVATKRDLAELVREGSFRADLYFRLNVMTVTLPPLRERPGDVRRLVKHFLRSHPGNQPLSITPEAMSRLVAHQWPGNVRELQNTVTRMIDHAVDGRIDSAVLQSDSQFSGAKRRVSRVSRHEDPQHDQQREVQEALDLCRGVRSAAARHLGVSRATLYRWLERYGIGRKPD